MGTRQLVRYIAQVKEIKLYESRLMAVGVKLVGRYIGVCGKVFGNLTYARDLADVVRDSSKEGKLKESIYIIEERDKKIGL